MNLFDLTLRAHIAAGVTALAVFWVPIVTKKGGVLHRRAGLVYVGAMMLLGATAIVLCVLRLSDDRPQNDPGAFFLLYQAMFSLTTTLLGVRILSPNRPPTRVATDAALWIGLFLGALSLGIYGLALGRTLFIAFAALGIFLAVSQLRFVWRAPRNRAERILAHMTGMGGSCIAALTAFTVLNAHRLGLTTWSLVVWLTPPVLGGIALTFAKRRYAKRLLAA